MKKIRFSHYLLGAAVLGLFIGSTAELVASNRWGCYHWYTRYISVGNYAAGDYYNIYREEVFTDTNSWNVKTKLVLSEDYSWWGGDINLFSGDYGYNGWLGLANIWPSGCNIYYAECRLNRTYLDSGYSRTAKEHVACQEVGHTFGLDHNESSSTTCMNDTILTAPQGNRHDFKTIKSITP